MTVEEFFGLFLTELEHHASLRKYYKFLESKGSFAFRKAYFCQRLQYIADNVVKKNAVIWDIGCGYGTTGIFLAMNGYASYGSTLEFYFKEIPQRLKYWSQHGNAGLFTAGYENIFDMATHPAACDYIILQDTLHHLEPLDKALQICYSALKEDGKLIAVEENGNNIVQSLKLFLKRGNKRIIKIYDEQLKKHILLGNENIRSLSRWEAEFLKQGLKINKEDIQYIRIYPPAAYKLHAYNDIITREQQLWNKSKLMKEYFFFGINFTAAKKSR